MNRQTLQALRREFESEVSYGDRAKLEPALSILLDIGKQLGIDLGDVGIVHQVLHEVIEARKRELQPRRRKFKDRWPNE